MKKPYWNWKHILVALLMVGVAALSSSNCNAQADDSAKAVASGLGSCVENAAGPVRFL